MKKILTLFLTIALTVASLGALTSCADSSDVPEGMKLVAGGEELGYYFYAPEGWAVSNVGEIKSAFVSRIDTSSVSFTEINPLLKNPTGNGKETDDYFFENYFTESLSEFPSAPTVSNNGEEIIFGKSGEGATKAKKYTFSYDYYDANAEETFSYAFMQILIKANTTFSNTPHRLKTETERRQPITITTSARQRKRVTLRRLSTTSASLLQRKLQRPISPFTTRTASYS